MILDVDFLPSANAYNNIQKYLHILDGKGRNALVIPAFEIDADVLNSDSSAIDNVRYKRRLRELYMFDKGYDGVIRHGLSQKREHFN